MEVQINLGNLLSSNFRFYLDKQFLESVLFQLKQKYKTWRNVANKLNINIRNLFGIRRCYEYWKGRKVTHFVNGQLIKNLSELSSTQIEDFEKNITMIKAGHGGHRDKILLPTKVNLEEEPPQTLKRALGEYLFISKYEKELSKIIKELPEKFSLVNGYVELNKNQLLKTIEEKVNELKRRGLRPICKELDNNILIEFVHIRNRKRITRIIPLNLVFDEIFSKQFGKWMGDKALSKNNIGIVNKNWNFITEFEDFLINKLLQPKEQIALLLYCNNTFSPTQDLLRKTNKVRVSATQYGDYAFVVGVYNKFIRNFIFDSILKFWFWVLINSPPSVRYAFYAGLFEADGSIDEHAKLLSWSFGLNLNSNVNQEKMMDLFKKSIMFKYLLSIDGFDSGISRKIGKTKKSFTLKYDVNICRNKITRKEEIKTFKNNILPYLSYENKIRRFNEVMKSNTGKTN